MSSSVVSVAVVVVVVAAVVVESFISPRGAGDGGFRADDERVTVWTRILLT